MALSRPQFERLPKTVEAKIYKLEFIPNVKDLTFHGNATICMTLSQPTQQILLNCKKIKILSASLHHTSTKSDMAVAVESIKYSEELELVTIPFETPLNKGDVELRLHFSGILADDMQGFYYSTYKGENTKDNIILCTQFESTFARRAFPCLDEPNRKAVFQVSLIVQDHLTALSCMPETSRTAVDGTPDGLPIPKPGRKYVRVTFADTPLMSTYLVAMVIGHFDFLEALDANGVRVRVYTPPNKSHLGQHAMRMATSALPFYTEIFGTGYPLPKLDLVALPDFNMGAMENWGLLTYRDTRLLIDHKQSSLLSKRDVALTVAHEIAHMWFGNLVTMEWWTHLWLNEGFATWIEFLAVDHCFPEYDIWTVFLTSEFYPAMATDELRSSHPIEVEVNSPNEVEEIFDAISYEKGSSIIRMINDYLGEKQFNAGLRVYINRHKFSNTVTNDLWKALSEVCPDTDLQTIMSTWTKQMGFPVLTVRPVSFEPKEGLTISIEQTRFLADGALNAENPEWYVPVTICEADNSENILARVMVPPPSTLKGNSGPFTVRIPPTQTGAKPTIRLNPGVYGFYRVQYADGLMSPILDALGDQRLPAIDRLSVLADTFALARAGRISMTTALSMASTLNHEADYTVWCELRTQLHSLRALLQETHYSSREVAASQTVALSPAEQAMNTFLVYLAGSTFKRLGWRVSEKEPINDTLLRPLLIIMLGSAGCSEVVSEALRRLDSHHKAVMAAPKGDSPSEADLIPPDLRVAVYSTCIKHGNAETVYEQLLDLHERSTMQDERVRILRCVGLTSCPRVVKRVIDLTLSEVVRKQDRFIPLIMLSYSAIGRRAVWDLVRERFTTLESDLGSGSLMSYVFKSCFDGFCTDAYYEEIKTFFKDHPVACVRSVQQALESIAVNTSIVKRDIDSVSSFLVQFAENTPEGN